MIRHTEHPHIAIVEPRRLESRRHAFRRQSATTHGQRGICFDQFLIQILERGLIRSDIGSGRGGKNNGKHRQCQKRAQVMTSRIDAPDYVQFARPRKDRESSGRRNAWLSGPEILRPKNTKETSRRIPNEH
jgi:hypothetical protein